MSRLGRKSRGEMIRKWYRKMKTKVRRWMIWRLNRLGGLWKRK